MLCQDRAARVSRKGGLRSARTAVPLLQVGYAPLTQVDLLAITASAISVAKVHR